MQILKYPNINAKLKAMYSTTITKKDLENIIKQNNLKNAIILLKNKSTIFRKTTENIDRLEIEGILEENQIQDLLKILKLINQKDKELLELFLLKYEIKCVKSMFRKLYANDKTELVAKNVKRWTTTLFDDIKGIETAENFKQFFQAIKRMKYNEILNKYESKENINIFELENELDKFYFELLYEKIKKHKNLRKIIGTEIDLLNISWIYRIKKYYNFETSKLKSIIINKNYKINANTINKLIEANTFKEMKTIMENTKYKTIFTEEKELENNIDKYLYKMNKQIFKNDYMSIAYIYAYINIIDYENNDIINTIEAIRYNVKKDEILKLLVR